MSRTGVITDLTGHGPTLELVDGQLFYLLEPNPEVLSIDSIAYSLANLCRYTGHCKPFYSVAQHCYHVSSLVPPEHAVAGLFHDASEAFIGDLSRPLKDALDTIAPGVIEDVEGRIHAVIAERFGFEYPFDPAIKQADNIALATEKRDLMTRGLVDWPDLPDPDPRRLFPQQPEVAALWFKARAAQLGVPL